MTDPTTQVSGIYYFTGGPDASTALVASADLYLKFKHVQKRICGGGGVRTCNETVNLVVVFLFLPVVPSGEF